MRTVIAAIVPFALAIAPARAGPRAASPLNLPLFPVPLHLNNVPLSVALFDLGVQVRGGYVVFGAEVRLVHGGEPTVKASVPAVETLGEALRLVFRSLPDYRYEVISQHLIDVYPASAIGDPADPLNIRVPRFDIANQQANVVLSRPEDFIPLLKAALDRPPKPGQLGGVVGSILVDVGPPPITLHLRDVSVRQILNAVSEATESLPAQYGPLGWVCSFQPDLKLPRGGSYTWRALFSTPSDWKPRTGAKATSDGPN